MECLLLRMEAPLISFGGMAIDAIRHTDAFPGRSMVTGLLGNALGYHHAQHEELERLQERLHLGVRRDLEGSRLTDYQTVDLGQSHLVESGWTTYGRVEARRGAFSTGTHQRYREFHVDASFLVAVALLPADEAPTVQDLAAALDRPARPLFLGRKSCLPSVRINEGVVVADSIEHALLSARPSPRAGGTEVRLWLSADEPELDGSTTWVSDRRDWKNQVHAGRRLVREIQRSLMGSSDG